MDDLVITEQPKTGWTVATHGSESVALDLSLSSALISAGQVREVVRTLQESRKSSGYEISDRILIQWNASEEAALAIEAALAAIMGEVLALAMERNLSLALAEGELGFIATLVKSPGV